MRKITFCACLLSSVFYLPSLSAMDENKLTASSTISYREGGGGLREDIYIEPEYRGRLRNDPDAMMVGTYTNSIREHLKPILARTDTSNTAIENLTQVLADAAVYLQEKKKYSQKFEKFSKALIMLKEAFEDAKKLDGNERIEQLVELYYYDARNILYSIEDWYDFWCTTEIN